MKVPLLLRMPEEIKAQLVDDAKLKGMTLTGLILSILNIYLAQQNKCMLALSKKGIAMLYDVLRQGFMG